MVIRRLLWLLLFLSMEMASCRCEDEYRERFSLQVELRRPRAGRLTGPVQVIATVTPQQPVHHLEVFLSPQKPSQRFGFVQRKLADLHTEPYRFTFQTTQVPDGFYKLKAVAYDIYGGAYESRTTLIYVVNEPPVLWFVNCVDGQWIRGVYPLVVGTQDDGVPLAAPPVLLLDREQGPKTTDILAPYRYALDTLQVKDGETLLLRVDGEDTTGNTRRIECKPRVDNTPPTVRIVQPRAEDLLVGRRFEVRFQAQDRFSIRQVRLWIDGSGCTPQDPTTPDVHCPKRGAPWISQQAPDYPIQITLPNSYRSEQSIVLSARAMDQAGNLSDPPTQLRLRVDPIPPEIFIRTPGEGRVFEEEISFSARVTDNQQLEEVKLSLRRASDQKRWTLRTQRIRQSETLFSFVLQELRKTYGAGKFWFVLQATDNSGNTSTKERLFRVGCEDSTDCPLRKVCHRTRCVTPAGLGQRCDTDTPCEIGATCVEGEAPVCKTQPKTFCRKRCNPGNQFVSADPCDKGFFCDRETSACLPAENCTPLGNDCPSGQHCTLADDDASYCVPIGDLPVGEACNQDCSTGSNCQRDAWCIILINLNRTTCARVCDTQSPQCPRGQRCAPLVWSFGGQPLRYGVCQ
ncbi:MAG: EB domain-containing protein [Myxococcota bacterium]